MPLPEDTHRIDIDGDRKVIDLHPLTTRKERRTLDDDALQRLRKERRAAQREARLERRENREHAFEGLSSLWRRSVASLALTVGRLGLRLDEDALKAIALETAARLADIPDPDGDGWTVEEVAVEIREDAVEQIDRWLAWAEWADALWPAGSGSSGTLAETTVAAIVNMLELGDGPVVDALIGEPVEHHLILLLTPTDGSEADGLSAFQQQIVDNLGAPLFALDGERI